MLTDIWISPDNLLSGDIRILNYPFNCPSIWLLTLFFSCTFSCRFCSKFLRHFQKFCTLVRAYPKYSRLDLNLPPLDYTSATLGYPPCSPFMISFDFSHTLVQEARIADRTASQHLWGSRDVIGHMSICYPIGHFLLVVLWNGVSISSRFRDIVL